MPKAKTSRSPLANPTTLIHQLASQVQDYLHLPDPSPLYIALGTLAGNMISGVPLWVMLIGNGGSGKTSIIDMIGNVPKVEIIGAIEGPASLLSGTGNKDKAKGATGGLLMALGKRGLLAPKDFTSTLSMPHEKLTNTIGALREIADGDWSRPLGTDGGKHLIWRGSVGFLGASTPKIDSYHKVIAELGQRWIFYRFEETDGYGETKVALAREDRLRYQNLCRELVVDFMSALSMEWSCLHGCAIEHKHTYLTRRKFDDMEQHRLIALGSFVSRARSAVPRDAYTHEVNGMTKIEPPMRLTDGLGQLYIGLEAIGLPVDERWRLIGKVAMDSMPEMRAVVIRQLIGMKVAGEKFELSIGEVERLLQCSLGTVKRLGQDMEILGVVERVGDRKSQWATGTAMKLTDWAGHELDRGLRQ